MRIAADNKINGALIRRRNVSTATRLSVHSVVFVLTLLYGETETVDIIEKECKKE